MVKVSPEWQVLLPLTQLSKREGDVASLALLR